jgi:hypothetical protein
MPGKKAHVKRNTDITTKAAGKARKSTGQTEGQFSRDPKGRKGQFAAAGDSPLIKK